MTDKHLALLLEVAAALASTCENEGRHSRAQSLREKIRDASEEANIEAPIEGEHKFRPGSRGR